MVQTQFGSLTFRECALPINSISCSGCKHDASNQGGDKLAEGYDDAPKLSFAGAIKASEGFSRQASSRSPTMTIIQP